MKILKTINHILAGGVVSASVQLKILEDLSSDENKIKHILGVRVVGAFAHL